MPSLNVRAIAEFLRLPEAKQKRILSEQKYPKRAPQIFRMPYYLPALTGIRSFYFTENKHSSLLAAQSKIESIAQEARRTNNNRVLQAFESSDLTARKLAPLANSRHFTKIGDVLLKVSPDLQAMEQGRRKVLYFNCRGVKLNEETARYTVEIAHWVLEQGGVVLNQDQIEFVDLFSGKLHVFKVRRSATIHMLKESVKAISAMWPDL